MTEYTLAKARVYPRTSLSFKKCLYGFSSYCIAKMNRNESFQQNSNIFERKRNIGNCLFRTQTVSYSKQIMSATPKDFDYASTSNKTSEIAKYQILFLPLFIQSTLPFQTFYRPRAHISQKPRTKTNTYNTKTKLH